MAAVIDFKWSAARKYFLRHAFAYFIFAFNIALITDVIKGVNEKMFEKSETFYYPYAFVNLLFYWLILFIEY